MSHFESVNEKCVQWNKLNSLGTAIYISEQICIEWHRTGEYYTAKVTFSRDFPGQNSGCVLCKCVYYIEIFTVSTLLTITANLNTSVYDVTSYHRKQ